MLVSWAPPESQPLVSEVGEMINDLFKIMWDLGEGGMLIRQVMFKVQMLLMGSNAHCLRWTVHSLSITNTLKIFHFESTNKIFNGTFSFNPVFHIATVLHIYFQD